MHGSRLPHPPNLRPDEADGVKLEDGVICQPSLIVIPAYNMEEEEEDGNKLKEAQGVGPVAMTALLMDTVLSPYIL